MGVYDTLEIPLKNGVPFSDRVASIKGAVENVRNPLESDIPFRSNPYYAQVVDLRPQGIEAILHLNARKTGTHKIQLVEAGHKCCGEIADTVAQITTEHPRLQAISRVDSCADVIDGPSVGWMAQSVRARSVQWQAQLGSVELRDSENRRMQWSEMGKRELQTMYLGKRPNCFRVYDKLAERFQTWRREKRRHEAMAGDIVAGKLSEIEQHRSQVVAYWRVRYGLKPWVKGLSKDLRPGAARIFPFPDFPTWLRANCVGPMAKVLEMPKLPKVLTRVERQMGAGRVPDRLNSFERIFSRDAVEFNPFERLNFSPFDTRKEIDIDDYSPVEFAAGMMFRRWLEEGEMTYQQMYAWWNKKRNAKRYAKKFAPFIAAANPAKVVSITSSELYEQYRESLTRQLAA
jgi:hypothetical protein